ncbi:MAG: tRNA (adenosine(37)-N6)-threonylcarbamoyltransferase complex dimerization subunit type 1 TsaB [Candidatus Sumerlaeia bacterium]|nr:tRNA (adenosine(37)-N6)-threonylcarbamoyltransferase complex dimerization subunit type 1 TsaB [Candidatus Sumerlaeia bacterium]
MIVMAFETASPSGGVALLRDGFVEGEMRLNNAQSHSRLALAFGEELLKTLRLTWDQVDLFAASHGPGSFTGIRVGLTAIKSLGWSLNKKVVTVSSLEALATVASSGVAPGRYVVPLLDARLGEIYGGVYRVTETRQVVLEGEEFATKPSELPRHLPGEALFCGEGAFRYFDDYLVGHGDLAREDVMRCSPAATGWLAWRRAVEHGTMAPKDVRAVYIREATTKKLDK